jgi:uncharacterized tellurite resistance protein B-like protein
MVGLIALVGAIVGGIAFWWWRAQQLKGAADNVIDIAGKARGMISRARFRQRAGQSVLAGVDSPGMAAATLLYSLAAQRQPVALADEQQIDQMLDAICQMNAKDREDAIAFAAWASGQVADTNDIVRRFLPIWTSALGEAQRSELVGMASVIAKAHGEPTDAQTLVVRRLREGLMGE